MTLADEWAALNDTELPEIPGSVENAVDLAQLIDDTSECVSVYITTRFLGPLKRGTLRACHAELQAILPTLSGPLADYTARLTRIAGGVLVADDFGRAGWLG